MIRDAWCAACNGPVGADENGCLRCQSKPRRTIEKHASEAIANRKRRRSAKQCINGALHPKPRDGQCRCDWCKDVHRRGLTAVLAAPRFPRPFGRLIWRRA